MDKTVFTSAVRTATANSAEQDAPDQVRGAIFFLNISAASGTTPTLDIKLQAKDPATGNWFDLQNASFAQKVGVGTDSLLVYPSTVETVNRRVSNVLPNAWRAVATIAGTTPSFTFSLGASLSTSVDHSKATRHVKGLPRFREVLKAKHGIIPVLQGPAQYMEFIWDLNETMRKEQVFIIKVKGSEYYVSKQALEHFTRAI